MYHRIATLLSVTLFFVAPLSSFAADARRPIVSIIIDDIGNDYAMGLALAELPYPLTLSFLPKRKYTARLAERAAETGKDIMLHLPMENLAQLPLGHGALTSHMSKQDFTASVNDSLASLPEAIGVNNHMGSKLTSNRTYMTWLMQILQGKNILFVDSVTSAHTIAARVARQHTIPSMSRDVFLDNKKDKDYIDKQFEQLISKARAKGNAIAIAHPHPTTVEYLMEKLPTLDQRGVAIAGISGLMEVKLSERYQQEQRARNFKLAAR